MRKFIIDTDTASDDAVALVLMLRAKEIEVLGITCVAGNVSLEKTLRNARISCEIADTYTPKFYAGAAKPMFTQHVNAENWAMLAIPTRRSRWKKNMLSMRSSGL